MIKNGKHAASTKKELDNLKKAKQEHEKSKDSLSSLQYKIGIRAFNGLIDDLQNQLDYYDKLKDGKIVCLKEKTLEDLSEILIATRISKGMSHKELGTILDVAEQQVQRYEATDYEGVRWETLSEIALALGLSLNFKTIQFHSNSNAQEFVQYLMSNEKIIRASEHLRQEKSFLFL